MPAALRSPTLALVAAVAVTTTTDGSNGTWDWLAQPTVAYLLLAVGITSVMVEIAHPGIVGTGVGGVAAVLAGLWSLSMQAAQPVGLLLVVVAAALFAAEVLAASRGVAGAAGTAALLVGGLTLVDDPVTGGVPAGVVVPTSLALGAAVVFVGRVALRLRQRPAITGDELYLGRDLSVDRAAGTTGQAFVEGAWWRLRSTGAPLVPGATVRVVAVDRLVLVVEPAPPPPVGPDATPTEPPWKDAP